MDGDGEVGAEDAQRTLIEYVRTLSGLAGRFTEAQRLAGDVNSDGAISVEDAQMILRYYVCNTLSGRSVTWEELLGTNAAEK